VDITTKVYRHALQDRPATEYVGRRLPSACDDCTRLCTVRAIPARDGEGAAPVLRKRPLACSSTVGLLRNYCQQARKTAELADLLAAARASTPEPDDHPLPRQNALHRSVVKLLIEGYESGASTYELAERYNLRRNTVRDTLRRAGFDLTVRTKRAALSEAQKAEARRLFASGATRRELMEMYGVSESTIKRILRTHAP